MQLLKRESDNADEGEMCFYYHHFFRKASSKDELAKVAYSVPYSIMRQVIKRHFEIQKEQDEFCRHTAEGRNAQREQEEEIDSEDEDRRERRKLLGLSPVNYSDYGA